MKIKTIIKRKNKERYFIIITIIVITIITISS